MKIKRISEGAEARIYSCNFLGFDSVIKRRIKKRYRLATIDEDIRVHRTKNEARILALVSSLGISSPGLLMVGKYDIYMHMINGTRLSEMLGSKTNLNRVFAQLGRYAAMLHNNNIVHGDYTPANVMVGKNGDVCLIDFGLSEMTNSMEERALDLLLMKRSVAGELFEGFLQGYRKECRDGGRVIERLGGIEKRGRYNTRSLITR